MKIEHTDDCILSKPFLTDEDECAPIDGDWDQPPGVYVEEVRRDNEPWCVTRQRAFDLMEQQEAEAVMQDVWLGKAAKRTAEKDKKIWDRIEEIARGW